MSAEPKKFFVTTPIYYVNDEPHIGHAYTTLIADIFTRYHKLMGYDTRFLTGTDEHGQKVEQSAKKRGIPAQQHCDEMSGRYQKLWKILGYEYDRFIRTTDPDHVAFVSKMLQQLWDTGEIYADEYEGLYYVSDEIFVSEEEAEKIRAEKPTAEIVPIKEKSYFFRMSRHVEWLKQYIVDHPTFIQPDFRRNEVLGFLNQDAGVKDLCISRPKSRLEWGIELPFDKDYVCYVWVDALLNYVSGAIDKDTGKNYWPADLHLIGKDILTTHCVYWPTLLHALKLDLPKMIFAHGWWLVGGEKMSKSVGNVLKPLDLIEKLGGIDNGGIDAMRHLLTRGMTLGNDAILTEDRMKAIVNGELANDFGNLLSRVAKLCNNTIPEVEATNLSPETASSGNESGIEILHAAIDNLKILFDASDEDWFGGKLEQLWQDVWSIVASSNKYFDTAKPWALIKANDPAGGEVLRTCLEVLRVAALELYPVMPGKMAELRVILGQTPIPEPIEFHENVWLVDNAKIGLTKPLFPRIDFDKAFAVAEITAKPEKPEVPKPAPTAVVGEDGLITIDEVKKVELIVAQILTAQRVEGTTKLLQLQLDDGHGVDAPRQIIAGIAEHYAPDDLIGRKIVIVANLKPAKLKGVLSNGMLLAAKAGGKLVLVTIAADIANGASVG